MVNTIFILDKTYNTTQILVGDKSSQRMFWDDLYTQEFDTGAETFEFSCYLDENVVEGNYVAFYYNNQYKLFTIMDMEQTHKKGRLVANCYCEIASLSLLNNYVREFSGDMNCIQFFEYILDGTDWHIGKYSTSLRDRIETIKVTKIESVWSLIEDYKDIFECEINVRVTYENGHVTGQYIDIYSDGGLGSSTLKRFEYGRNVTGITKKKELYDWCTGVILDVDCDVSDTIIEEKDGYGFTKGAGDIILNDNANRMYNAGRNYVIGVYEGDETEPVEACINAWEELKKRSTPRFDYEVTTALTEDEYEEVHLGDTVYVVDRSYTPPLFLEARVGKLELSFTDRTQNKCVLTNYKEIKSKLLDADYIKLTGTITDIVNAFFPITSEGIADGAIVDGKIETTYFQQITADIVSAGIGAFEELYAQGMTVINADIENLRATNADIDSLKAKVAEIDTLINGHLTSDNIQSLILTADKVTVADAFIKNAMIDTISASKITAGRLNTSLVDIQSEDGGVQISGSLQQFRDSSGKVRIQIGKDANGDFTFALFSQDGVGVLIDENGIKEGAIGDGLIVDDMVSDNANIQGGKLDINSVITSINNGTTTINSNRIYLDEEGQSLKVAFEQLKTKVETIEDVTVDGDLSSIIEQVTSNTTNINIMQGEISSLISNTTITKENGQVVQLKDEYNSTKNTVDSHTTKIGSLETTVNSVSSKQASMQLDLNGFKTEVSNTYATKEELGELGNFDGSGFVTKTEFEQTTSDFTFKFSQTGGYNLVKNSTGAGGTDLWIPWNLTEFDTWTISDTNISPTGKDFCIRNNSTTDEGYVYSSRFALKPNTTYRFSIFLTTQQNVKSADVFVLASDSIEVGSEDYYTYSEVHHVVQGIHTNGDWKHITQTFTTGDNIKSGYVRIDHNGMQSQTDSYVYIYWASLMVKEGELEAPWSPHPSEAYEGMVKFDESGITVNTLEGGYSTVNADGLAIYNSAGNRTAWFGENDSAYIDSISTNKLKCPTVVRINDDCPTDLYCAPNATGDGTGRNESNKANSITNALEWLRKEYGCYNYKKDIRIHLENGDYWGGATYIGGWLGSGIIRIIFDDWACLRDSVTIEENTMTVSMEGKNDPWSYNKLENGFILVGNISAITVRNAHLNIGGVTIRRSGWGGNIGTWTNYDCQAIVAKLNANVYCANCDMIGFYNIARCERNSKVTIWNNRGHVYRLGHALTGGEIIVHGDTPLRNDSTYTQSGGQKVENLGNQVNSTYDPKPDAPYTPPPAPTEDWRTTETTFWNASMVSYPEGSGTSASARADCWGQGRYSSYQAHRGFCAFDSTAIANWCSGARNIRVYITMTRLNTAHGYAGAVPVPKLKKRNGSFWSCGVAFARGDTKTFELPYEVYSWLTEKHTTVLEMWAGTSNTDYSFYNNTSIRIVCEKNFA